MPNTAPEIVSYLFLIPRKAISIGRAIAQIIREGEISPKAPMTKYAHPVELAKHRNIMDQISEWTSSISNMNLNIRKLW